MTGFSNRRFRRWAIGVSVALFLIVVSNGGIEFFTDWLWFASLGQAATFRTSLLTKILLWLAGALLALAVLGVNWLLIPRRYLNQVQLPFRGRRRVPIQVSSRFVVIILCVLITFVTITFAGQTSLNWLEFLTFRYATPFGLDDPLFHQDVGFYIFQLPVYRFLTLWFLALVIVAVIGSGAIYLLTGRIRSRLAAQHLSLLGSLFFLLKAVDYQLQRFGLLQSWKGVVFGAGYTDVHARLPLLYILTALVLVGAVLMVLNVFARRTRLLVKVTIAWLALSLMGSAYPSFVQRFTVQPNELALERPYIERSIEFTRRAYKLDDVEERDFAVTDDLSADEVEANSDILNNVRLWDWRPLRTTYEQLQEIRTYYTFPDVDIDRYEIDGSLRQVALAIRELDIEQLREDAQTWVNEHLIYTHGTGLCLSPVSEVTSEGLPNFLVRDIPPRSSHPELEITRSAIYFGEATDNYIIVNTSEDEFDFPSGDKNIYARYEGPDGVRLGGLFRRALFAARFDSSPILISSAITRDSRILFHRDLEDRVRTLAPMLWYDPDPYPVLADGRIVWLYDAYTWSDRYPYSQPGWNEAPVWGLNYIRNSVKVAIDAYTGETTFYVVDPNDPIIKTYSRIFPTLFVSGDLMPAELRAHWRYPEQLFRIQADIYGAYHMQDARVFYNQEDLWQTPTEIRDVGETLMDPYYVTMRLPGAEAPEFMMIRPYVPAGKQNMIAWLYADSDGEDYGQLGVFKFSKDALVYGPIQVEARMDQDPYISQQLTLWNQRGSSVLRGNLMVIPIDNALIYVEPLYLQAESGRLPELKRVLVAYGNRVAMADTLADGLAQVLGVAPVIASPEIEPLPGDTVGLARSAQAHYEAAQACLQRGDWTCYGDELDALKRDLDALVAATEE